MTSKEPPVSAEVKQIWGSISRHDLAMLPEVAKCKPISKAEKSFQQFNDTNVAQWHVCLRNGKWWPDGPLFFITPCATAASGVKSDEEALALAVIEHLGPAALSGGKMSVLEAFEKGWKAHAAPQAKAEPVLYQVRVRPMRMEAGKGWTTWEECSAAAYEDYLKTPVLCGWQYEVRKLFAAPPAAQQLSEEHIEEFARNFWNNVADGGNQWDALDGEEKEDLINKVRTFIAHPSQDAQGGKEK